MRFNHDISKTFSLSVEKIDDVTYKIHFENLYTDLYEPKLSYAKSLADVSQENETTLKIHFKDKCLMECFAYVMNKVLNCVVYSKYLRFEV